MFGSFCAAIILTLATGSQHPEHERRARRANVQELPVEYSVPPRRYELITYIYICAILLNFFLLASDGESQRAFLIHNRNIFHT